jgi:hypothetical protein
MMHRTNELSSKLLILGVLSPLDHLKLLRQINSNTEFQVFDFSTFVSAEKALLLYQVPSLLLFEAISKRYSKDVTKFFIVKSSVLLALYPLELARTILAHGSAEFKFSGVAEVLKHVYNLHGIAGLFCGVTMSLAGTVLFNGVCSCLYGQSSLSKLEKEEEPKKTLKWKYWVFLIGIPLVSGLIVFPLDTIRRRMMLSSVQPQQSEVGKAATNIWNAQGVLGFFKGYPETVVRALMVVLISQVMGTSLA